MNRKERLHNDIGEGKPHVKYGKKKKQKELEPLIKEATKPVSRKQRFKHGGQINRNSNYRTNRTSRDFE